MDELLVGCLNNTAYIVYDSYAPQEIKKPYAVYSVIANTRDNHSKGQGDLKEVRYQIEAYADVKATAVGMIAEFEAALLGCANFEAFIYQSFGNVEDDTKTYRAVLDFKLWK